MLALSVSISTSGSPRFTSPPSCTSHCSTVPSSIESDSRGINTSVAMSQITEGRKRGRDDMLLMGKCRLLQGFGVRHGHIGSCDPGYGRVEIVEGLLLDQSGQVGAHAAMRPAL